MKRKTPTDKLAQKRAQWLARTMTACRVDEPTARQLLTTQRRQSVRLNPLRTDDKALEFPGKGSPYAWMTDGYAVDDVTMLRESELASNGQLFIQNAASWLPVLALDPQPDDVILDICAAPGGKTSHIAAITNNEAQLWANDNSRARLAKLQANMTRLGVEVACYTLYDATKLARKLEGQRFTKILLDAPCSGEGLMNYGRDKDFATWSVAHIKRLQQLQKRILTQAWQLLEPGGTLVYSTCTMAPEENEAVIDYLLRTHEDAAVQLFDLSLPNRIAPVGAWNDRQFNSAIAQCVRLVPSETIEAFFVCKLQKLADRPEIML